MEAREIKCCYKNRIAKVANIEVWKGNRKAATLKLEIESGKKMPKNKYAIN